MQFEEEEEEEKKGEDEYREEERLLQDILVLTWIPRRNPLAQNQSLLRVLPPPSFPPVTQDYRMIFRAMNIIDTVQVSEISYNFFTSSSSPTHVRPESVRIFSRLIGTKSGGRGGVGAD